MTSTPRDHDASKPVQSIEDLVQILRNRDWHERTFHQAVEEVLEDLKPVFEREPKYYDVCRRLIEPERVISFRVPWTADDGSLRINRGYRVQFSQALGPYKGGLRFHPTVCLDILKFLAFEQILKNSLTGLPLGAGKGGSDFDPKGKSDAEVQRFCASFMTELSRHIGPNTDVPAGDIGVGGREIGYLFGQYKRLTDRFEGVLTGKGWSWGGSLIRPEATGYGLVYFTDEMFKATGGTLAGKRVALSGSGNVAQFATEKLLDLGAVPITMSDSGGFVTEPEGFTREKLAILCKLKNVDRGRLSEYPKLSPSATYTPNARPWGVKCDVALPCATQNEVNEADALQLVANGCQCVAEGANMPSDPEAIKVYITKNIMFGPAKAANAGGVAVSGLEMTQNSQRLSWTRDEVDAKLKEIMANIFKESVAASSSYGLGNNLKAGANIAGFLKVADAMIAQGPV